MNNLKEPDSLLDRISNLSRDKQLLLHKKLEEKRLGLPQKKAVPLHTELLDDTILFKQSLIRNQEMMQRDSQLRAHKPSASIVDDLSKKCRNSIEFLAAACEHYSDRPALGYRAFDSDRGVSGNRQTAKSIPEFRTFTFSALWDRITFLATGLRRIFKIRPQDRIGILGFASPDFLVADFACLYLAATSIPLQTTMPPGELKKIIDETGLCCLVCSVDALGQVVDLVAHCPGVRALVVMDYSEADEHQVYQLERKRVILEKRGGSVQLMALGELESIGRQDNPAPMEIPAAAIDPVMTVIYTSGSSGSPKGALYTESVWSQYWRLPILNFFGEIPLITMVFMPLNHLLSRMETTRCLLHGGTTYFTFKSDMSTLFEDIRLVRPTTLSLVPRISQMIYHHFQLEVGRRSKTVFDKVSRKNLEQEVMIGMRSTFLGDRLLLLTNGSAPLSPDIFVFLKRCFQVPVIDGYASTEAGLITRNGRINSTNIIGYKLVDVPELSYFTTDKPYPRGELCIKSRLSIPGYLGNPGASKELYDEQGYIRTGDIVEERGPGNVIWLDRAKNVLKLSQGEFVGISRLEAIFSGSNIFIHQIYLYGNSHRTFLLAVIVPNQTATKEHLGLQYENLEAVKQIIRKEINDIAVQHKLQSYEIPRDFIIEASPFSKENSLLTESGKAQRPNLNAKYARRLESLYDHLEMRQQSNAETPQTISSETSSKIVVMKALETVLGITNVDLNDRFTDTGGDSLASVHFSELVQKMCGIPVPVSLILDPARTLSDIAIYIENQHRGESKGAPQVTLKALHGDDASIISVKDLDLKKLLTPEELKEAVAIIRTMAAGPAKVVMLSGANGFLGRSLIPELLDRLPGSNGKLICIVRAKDDEAASGRLLDGFGDADMRQRGHLLKMMADGRLSVYAGDLSKPKFGLDANLYDHLAREVDSIIHGAALVNHAFSYEQLFEPNVIGTIEVIRFALNLRPKSINFISSIGIVAGLDRGGRIYEDQDVRTLWRERPTQGGYAVGYSTSKWAGEVLLRELHQQTELPINVFRCGMILPGSRQTGQINAADFFSRLVNGLINTRIAPQSFYETEETAKRAHFGGLPVDFVGSAVARISLNMQPKYSTYHVVNPHRDAPVSLDRIVDWISSAGYRITRILDYPLWFQLFTDRLQKLGASQQRHSPLPIVHHWQHPINKNDQMDLDACRFLTRLDETGRDEGVDLKIPNLSEAYIHKCLKDMNKLGLIGPGNPEEANIMQSS